MFARRPPISRTGLMFVENSLAVNPPDGPQRIDGQELIPCFVTSCKSPFVLSTLACFRKVLKLKYLDDNASRLFLIL
jgi:hypothetical protein